MRVFQFAVTTTSDCKYRLSGLYCYFGLQIWYTRDIIEVDFGLSTWGACVKCAWFLRRLQKSAFYWCVFSHSPIFLNSISAPGSHDLLDMSHDTAGPLPFMSPQKKQNLIKKNFESKKLGAAACVQPMDLVKNRMQVSGEGGGKKLYRNRMPTF